MLDDVERRAFLVQPARKHPLPGPAGLFDVKLDEGPGEALIFPRCGRIAGAQAHHRIAEADRLARLHGDVADDPVALVEQPEHRHALAHRRHPGERLDRLRHVDRHGIGAIDGLLGVTRKLVAARAKRDQRQQDKAAEQNYSGFHAW